ncbi:hypothetical protein [Corynebacterium crudilactis]|uniref:ABC transporter substrate-binding protein n=1 Tax=Corynebacterium crudilactis TaxID=1652495 RepID=A0A172QSN2_9CORY|nr:hypothetical protein [Corynebacterium crudilactis]ANE03707.1 hypothetical protein ccrud_05440 [Corynebacterium crudilactis]
MKNVGKQVFILALVGSLLAGCSSLSQEPAPPVPLGNMDTVQIISPSGNAEAFFLGKLYETALVDRGRSATLQLVDGGTLDMQLTRLREDSTDLVIACSGELLEYYNPDLAQELKAEYATLKLVDKNSGEWREKIYDAVQGSLPNSLVATDPSNAVGCENNESLPQNIVPIYRKPNLARGDRETLNLVSGALSTEDLKTLVEETRSSGVTSESSLAFLRSKGF